MNQGELNHLISEYRAIWQQGHRPRLEEFVFRNPSVDAAELLRELLRVDLIHLEEMEVRISAAELSNKLTQTAIAIDATLSGIEDTQVVGSAVSPASALTKDVDLRSDSADTPTTCDTVREASRSQEALQPPARTPEFNSHFGDYQLIRELGRGGMGIVYQARQVSLNRLVAIKTILAPQFASGEKRIRFQREAEAAARLDHPGIVTVYESGVIGDAPFFSMAYVDGGTLSDKLKVGPLQQWDAASMLAQIASTVDFAHRHGVVHRDLKPANILLDESGQPLVADFGLAKVLQEDSDVTTTGNVIGTPSYMAPEQASGQPMRAGPAADIYSLGAILYRTLTGRAPFQEESPTNTLLAVLNQEVVSPRQLRPSIHRDLETICLKCLQKAPEDRYRCAGELERDLRRFLNDDPIEAKPVGVVRTAWRWYTGRRESAVVVAGVYATIIGTIFLMWNLLGLTAIWLQEIYQDTRLLATQEILIGIMAQSIPTILAGWGTLLKRRWALYAGAAISTSALVFTLRLYTGASQLVSTRSESYDALGGLLLILSAIGVLLYAIALYAHHKKSKTSVPKALPATK